MRQRVQTEKRRPRPTDLFLSFLRLGITAFGGPAMIPCIGEMSVNRKKWLDQKTFEHGVVLCQSIPGAAATLTAAFVGMQAGGISGALVSYAGLGLPAFLCMIILSILYAAFHELPWIMPLLAGMQVIVVALVAHAVYSFGKTSLKGLMDFVIAAASAIAFFLETNPFYVIAGAGLAGAGLFHEENRATTNGYVSDTNVLSFRRIAAIFVSVIAGLICLACLDAHLRNLAFSMVKISLFAFGGGFASLPLMVQEFVNVQGLLDSKTFMDGVALGQITPGPVVITATFVGYLTYGFAGAAVATVAIFTPSFLLFVMIAPLFDRMRQSRFSSGALRGALASFVGLLLFTAIKFAFVVPWEPIRILIAAGAFAALIRKIEMLYVAPVGAVISMIFLR